MGNENLHRYINRKIDEIDSIVNRFKSNQKEFEEEIEEILEDLRNVQSGNYSKVVSVNQFQMLDSKRISTFVSDLASKLELDRKIRFSRGT